MNHQTNPIVIGRKDIRSIKRDKIEGYTNIFLIRIINGEEAKLGITQSFQRY
jgi:hypothetical protein